MFGYSPQGYEALSTNRQRLLEVLIAAQITEVIIHYVGGGDEGDITEVIVKPESCLPQLNTQRLVYCYARGEYRVWSTPAFRAEFEAEKRRLAAIYGAPA